MGFRILTIVSSQSFVRLLLCLNFSLLLSAIDDRLMDECRYKKLRKKKK